MVSCEKIIEACREWPADVIGLSGLITPSLEEMTFNVREFERAGLRLPVLIGGATTSKLHTAVKIAPASGSPVLHVADASLVTEVLARALGQDRAAYLVAQREEQQRVRAQYEAAQAGQDPLVPLATARSGRFSGLSGPSAPPASGVFVDREIDLRRLAEYIDWSPFFWTWGLKGVFPRIFDHPRHGGAAREIYQEAQRWWGRIQEERLFRPRAVWGVFPARAEGDDVVILGDQAERVVERFCFLRQQEPKTEGKPHLCLADYVGADHRDALGVFVVTAGHEVDALADDCKRRGDDYGGIMVKALGDRIAEAMAEMFHQRARCHWGYGTEERLSLDDLLAERYRGIRPAPGYPACPDHSEKLKIWRLLGAETHTGARLTETFAMQPAATVSGFYFAHPEARYFHVGRIGDDQLRDYARRKGLAVDEVRKWLSFV
jgi:5-methyltetrahydrofolate--homocysteine methyltransferase